MSVKDNVAIINENISKACKAVDRDPNEITVIAVTKYVSIDRAKEAIDAGVVNLGENRKEGFLDKHQALGEEATWHFIGSLQSRKVKEVIEEIDILHSLDRKSLAKEINKRREQPLSCFVQVNVSGEESKHGLAPEEVLDFVKMAEAYGNIRIIGLMTMAPHVEDEEKLRAVFRKLRALRDEVQAQGFAHAPCDFLSMGMSNDYEIAIEEGATHIRIGTSLVGNESNGGDNR
ncbi:YggS family pyridoxal phosphate-dependent enzyme [Salimicrobium halophilum]|uniref:YggS family pyridoxal phosphate-dependent enzyme n=1 Tax=Salimicrobium halophilum TaxID=86666 RepID=UPI0015A32556|nr:YggS family pyridoxal phosphate-dependent enzyme [Salimicrobium halophilum]